MAIRGEGILSFLLAPLKCHQVSTTDLESGRAVIMTSFLFSVMIPSPMFWQTGTWSATLPPGLRGFILCIPFPRRKESGANPGCSCHSASCSCLVTGYSGEAPVTWMQGGDPPSDPVWEYGKGGGRAEICKRVLGRERRKANQAPAAWERKKWSKWAHSK